VFAGRIIVFNAGFIRVFLVPVAFYQYFSHQAATLFLRVVKSDSSF